MVPPLDLHCNVSQERHKNDLERNSVKPVLRGHSKIDKTKVLKINRSLMVESIAECYLGAFCNTFELH